MQVFIVKTEKITGHEQNGEPVREKIVQKIHPYMTFEKFVKYLPNQNYRSVELLKVMDGEKEVKDISEYEKMITDALKPVANEKVDYKHLSEKQSAEIEDLKGMVKTLMNKLEPKGSDRDKLEAKAKELEIEFRSNIGDSKLLEKIQEKEPEFKL